MARQSSYGSRKRPFRRLGLAVIMAGLFGLVISQTAPQIRSIFQPARTIAADQLATNASPGFWSRITGQTARDRRIAELEAEVRDLSRWKAAALSMAERMETYEGMLNALGEPPARGVTARVAAESDGPFSETLLVNAGSLQGVEPGAIAVNEGGLVGRVIQLGERSSRVLLVTDFNNRVPVMGEVSGLRAILYGGRDGLGSLTDLPEAGAFIPGERILTSGEGGVYSRGLLAGVLADQGGTPRVLLAMKTVKGGFVRLIPPANIPKPEDSPENDVQVVAETGADAPPAEQ